MKPSPLKLSPVQKCRFSNGREQDTFDFGSTKPLTGETSNYIKKQGSRSAPSNCSSSDQIEIQISLLLQPYSLRYFRSSNFNEKYFGSSLSSRHSLSKPSHSLSGPHCNVCFSAFSSYFVGFRWRTLKINVKHNYEYSRITENSI
jgi:hypothetical protein